MAYIDNVNKVLNIQPEAAPTRVRLSQNENGRNLYFALAGNENPIPSGVTVTISGTKPDGTVYSGTGSISNDVVLIPETVQLTAVAGVWDAKVKITSGGNTVATGRIRFLIDADTVAPGSVPSSSVLEGLVEQAQQYAETARQEAYGSTLTAALASDMTDKTRVYVYTGSEVSYTAGHWYYWNGSAWSDGGVYNSTAVQTDKTLSLMDVAADGKAVGDAIAEITIPTDKTLTISDAPADAFVVGEKLALIKEMIAGVEVTSTATKAYAIGDLVIVGDVLYKMTKAITSGTQIGLTNAQKTTIADMLEYEITDLKSKLYERIGDLDSEQTAIKGMIAGTESAYTARKDYNVGDLIIIESSLFKATAAIATGSPINASNVVATTIASVLTSLKGDYNCISAKISNANVLVIEQGNINLSGEDVTAANRARTRCNFNNSFILTTKEGYIVKNVMKYNYDINGNVAFAGYETLNQGIVVFMAGYYMNGPSGTGKKADVYRLSFAKTSNDEITTEDISNIIDSIVPVVSSGIVHLTGIGTSGTSAGVTSVGDIYYNNSTKKLRVLVSGITYYTVPFAQNTLYTIGTNAYKWNGTDLIRVDSDIIEDVEALRIDTDALQVDVASLGDKFELNLEQTFVQGGISLSGQDDNSSSSTRIRTGYINTYKTLSFSVSDTYEARIVLYDKGGKFISITGYGQTFDSIDNVSNLVRFLVRHKDNSAILASEMQSGVTYDLQSEKNIYESVAPINFIEPVLGNIKVYTSSALEHTEIDSKTSAELFAEYDSLVQRFPRYIKRDNDIGLDAYGNTIRAYTVGCNFMAVYDGESGTTNIWDDSYNYKTILITSGVHGGEKTASWGLMLAVKDILESSDDWASFIKGNLILKIIPCVNVWGFDNNSRLNYKDVNVNRDAYTWASEEGQALKEWYDANTAAVYYMDVHGTNGGRGYQEIWKLSPYKMIHCQNCAKISAVMYDNWVTKFGRFPTFPAIISSFDGLLVSYMEAKNIPSAIVEIPRDIVSGGTENYLDACAYAKDVIINLLQACGQIAFRSFPIL